MKNIILIGPVYPYKGGIAHYTSLLYRALSSRHNVEMISYKMQYPKFLFKKEQKDYSDDMFRIEHTKFLIHTANPFNIVKVGRKIRQKKPDMVVIQWWHPYFPVFDSLLSIKTAVDQYLWGLQRFCLLF